MGPEGLLIFVGIIVGACIAGGAIYAGLCRVAEAIIPLVMANREAEVPVAITTISTGYDFEQPFKN